MTFAHSLHDGGVVHMLVACGMEGLDGISCAGEMHVWELHNVEYNQVDYMRYIINTISSILENI